MSTRDDLVPVLEDPQHLKRVRAILALGGVPVDDLDDGVQEVNLKVLEASSTADAAPIRKPAAWIYVVASRVAVDWHRSTTRDTQLTKRLQSRFDALQNDSTGDAVLTLAVLDCLNELDHNSRQVLTLRFYVDLQVKDIAAALVVPEGTVKSRLHKAMNAMRERLIKLEINK